MNEKMNGWIRERMDEWENGWIRAWMNDWILVKCLVKFIIGSEFCMMNHE